MAAAINWGSQFVGVLAVRALLLCDCIRAACFGNSYVGTWYILGPLRSACIRTVEGSM